MATLNLNKPDLVVNPLHTNGSLTSTSITTIHTVASNHCTVGRSLRVTNVSAAAATLLAQTMDSSNASSLKGIFNASVAVGGAVELGPLTLDEADAIKLTAGTANAFDWVLIGDDLS